MTKYVLILQYDAPDDEKAWDIADEIEDAADVAADQPTYSHGIYLAEGFQIQGEAVPA